MAAEHIEWTKDLDLGIPEIDGQHRVIVQAINKLIDVGGTEDMGVVMDVMEQLIQYTISHFEYEELLQVEAKYTAFESHKAMHGIFTKQIEIYRRRAAKGEDISHALAQMLKAWLISHIKNEDVNYVPTVKGYLDDSRLNGVRAVEKIGWGEAMLKRVFG